MRIFVAIPLCHLALQALLFSFGASPAIAAPETIRIAVDRAVEVWRWQRFWDGESALDFAFSAPAPKRITLFWIEKSDALRFAVCKEDRTICVVPWLRPFSLALALRQRRNDFFRRYQRPLIASHSDWYRLLRFLLTPRRRCPHNQFGRKGACPRRP